MDKDPEATDDEYEEKVKEAYRRKPKDFKLLLMKSIHAESNQKRKRKNPSKEASENKKKKVQPEQVKGVMNPKSYPQQ